MDLIVIKHNCFPTFTAHLFMWAGIGQAV